MAGTFDKRKASPSGELYGPYGLSRTELRTLGLLTQGLADKEIAAELGVSTSTVNKHLGGILRKMDARSRTEAAIRAIKQRIFGLVIPGTVIAEPVGLLVAGL
jgi:DNA-binding NarL/FixJ family response regulator